MVFFALLFLSLAVVFSLVAPRGGFLRRAGSAMADSTGFLAAFIPVGLFLAGSAVLGLSFAKRWLAAAGAVFICSFFLSALITTILVRIRPELLYLTGGELTGRTVLAAESLVGGILAWTAFSILFLMSLVVFTGWDIAEAINSLLSRKKERTAAEPRRAVTVEQPAEAPASVWRKNDDIPVPQTVPVDVPRPVETAVVRETPPAVDPSPPIKVVSPVSTVSSQDPYSLPAADFLKVPHPNERVRQTKAEITSRADLLVSKLAGFGVECTVAGYCDGPVITRYELTPGPGVKVNRILNLSNDLALGLEAKRIRILAPIPGKGAVGIEVPNRNPETVYLAEILSEFKHEKIPVALGKTLEGKPYATDLSKMPHLLIAGATGSGKSVCVHAIISTILLTRTPHQVKLAMIDPKMLELSAYTGIPHLWSPVVTKTDKAGYLLQALVREMEERYDLLARTGVRSISEFNSLISQDQAGENMPYIVVIIDELADLMMVASRDVEPPITRLAQMARAVGIHLVVATQRPSVDVITGVIKANFPSRIAFNVQSMTDSRTILDMNGAEKLLGKGDMLFIPFASPEPVRIHGSFVSTGETRDLVKFWQGQPEMPFEFEPGDDPDGNLLEPGEINYDDPLLEEVKNLVISQQTASVSMIQRRFRVGYARAGKLIDMLERMGVVGPHVGSKPREVLILPGKEETDD